MFKIKNVSFAKKSKIAIKNSQNNAFVMFVFFEQNVANVLLKNTSINIKK